MAVKVHALISTNCARAFDGISFMLHNVPTLCWLTHVLNLFVGEQYPHRKYVIPGTRVLERNHGVV